MKLRGSIGVLLTALAATLAILALPSTASAAKVANPGTFTASVTDGFLRIKTQTFGFDPSNPITFAGTIDSQGNVNIPTSGQTLPADADLDRRLRPDGQDQPGPADHRHGQPDDRRRRACDCGSGSRSTASPSAAAAASVRHRSPIDVNALITGTTARPGPNSPITGTAYNADNGTMKVVNNNFSVPTLERLRPGARAPSTTSSACPRPRATTRPSSSSAPRRSSARASPPRSPSAARAASSPHGRLRRLGLHPRRRAAQLPVGLRRQRHFDRTTRARRPASPTRTPAPTTRRSGVTDVDGDIADATRTITVVEPPDLTIDKTHTELPGRHARATTRSRPQRQRGPTNRTMTVTDTLPAGRHLRRATGTGWTCGDRRPGRHLHPPRPIAANATAPAIDPRRERHRGGAPRRQQHANVSTTGDSNAANNTDTDPTNVTAIDLAIDKSHTEQLPPRAPIRPTYTSRSQTSARRRRRARPRSPTRCPRARPHSADGHRLGLQRIAGQTSPAPAPLDSAASAGRPDRASRGRRDRRRRDARASVTNTASVATAGDTDSRQRLRLRPDARHRLARPRDRQRATTGNLHRRRRRHLHARGRQRRAAADQRDHDRHRHAAGRPHLRRARPAPAGTATRRGQDVTCVHADPIAGRDGAADRIELDVSVGLDAIPSVDQHRDGGTAGDDNPANDSDTDPTTCRAIDLDDRQVPRRAVPGRPRRAPTTSTWRTSATRDDRQRRHRHRHAARRPHLRQRDRRRLELRRRRPGRHLHPRPTRSPPASAAATITLDVDVERGASERRPTRRGSSTTDDYNPANNSSTDETAIVETDAAVAINRTGGFRAGSTGTYLLAVDNDGITPTSGTTTLTATLPAGLNFVSAEGDGWTCDEDAGASPASTPNRSPAEESPSPTSQLRVAIDRDAPASVTTTAEVSTADDRNPDNDTASDTDHRQPAPTSRRLQPHRRLPRRRHGHLRARRRQRRHDATRDTDHRHRHAAGRPRLRLRLGRRLGLQRGRAGVVTCTRTAELDVEHPAPTSRSTSSRPGRGSAASPTRSRSRPRRPRRPDNDSDSDLTEVEMIDLAPRARSRGRRRSSAARSTTRWSSTTSATRRPPARRGSPTHCRPGSPRPRRAAPAGTARSPGTGRRTCDHDGILAPSEQAAC